MGSIPKERKPEIRQLIEEGGMTTKEIAEKFGVPVQAVRGIKAALTRWGLGGEEIIEAGKITFGLERDLQKALRSNIEQLEKGLKIVDGGKEKETEAGKIDILAQDKNHAYVVIELKAGEASPDSIAQILAYMSSLKTTKKVTVRGILVAGDFNKRVILAAQSVPGLELKKFEFTFSFESM
jgi:transposase-like protein